MFETESVGLAETWLFIFTPYLFIYLSQCFSLLPFQPILFVLRSIYLTTLLLGRPSPLSGYQYCAHSFAGN